MGNDLYFKMSRERRVLLQRISMLERENAALQSRLEVLDPLICTIPPIQFSPAVIEWMAEYNLPWELFWCHDHRRWMDELDNSFPYFWDNTCPGCRGEDKS